MTELKPEQSFKITPYKEWDEGGYTLKISAEKSDNGQGCYSVAVNPDWECLHLDFGDFLPRHIADILNEHISNFSCVDDGFIYKTVQFEPKRCGKDDTLGAIFHGGYPKYAEISDELIEEVCWLKEEIIMLETCQGAKQVFGL